MQSSSQIIATNKPTSSFLQAGCPSCRPTNSVKALKGNLSFEILKTELRKLYNKSALTYICFSLTAQLTWIDNNSSLCSPTNITNYPCLKKLINRQWHYDMTHLINWCWFQINISRSYDTISSGTSIWYHIKRYHKKLTSAIRTSFYLCQMRPQVCSAHYLEAEITILPRVLLTLISMFSVQVSYWQHHWHIWQWQYQTNTF